MIATNTHFVPHLRHLIAKEISHLNRCFYDTESMIKKLEIQLDNVLILIDLLPSDQRLDQLSIFSQMITASPLSKRNLLIIGEK